MTVETIGLDALSSLRGLTGADLLILVAIIIIWPIYSAASLKRNPVEKLRRDPRVRLTSYNHTMILLWGLAISIMIVWKLAGRPYEALGFNHTLDTQTLIAWGVAISLILYFAVQLYQVINSEAVREKLSRQLNDLGEYTQLLMPRTIQEHRRSMLVGFTAGVTEEIIFRGYIIWAFSLFFHMWLAGIFSICLFVFLHRYQDRAGLIQVAGFAVITTALYLICGSLWPGILLHIGVDLLNISLAWKIGKARNLESASP